MSEKIRRQKDIIKNSTKSYLEATKAYQNYFDGTSPVDITFYQIADEASRTDTSLEDTREVIGTESSIYYNRIKHVQVYGISALDISNQLTQRGLESFINGDFVMTPDLNINPRSGEFFAFEDENMPELCSHLFVITDVQYDRATSQKFFKCSFKLYPADTDNIFSHVVGKYVYDPNGNGNSNGVGDSVLITEEASANKSAIMELRDGLIDKFEELFYDEGMDTFVYQKPLDMSGTNFCYYWSPYVCHFIYKNKILEKSHRDFLTEIYVQDINEREFPAIYSEKGYRGTLFHALEQDDIEMLDRDYCTFMEIAAYDLNKPLNLPFFSTSEKFYLVDVMHPYNSDFWMGAFDWINSNEDNALFDPKAYDSSDPESRRTVKYTVLSDGRINYKIGGASGSYLASTGENGEILIYTNKDSVAQQVVDLYRSDGMLEGDSSFKESKLKEALSSVFYCYNSTNFNNTPTAIVRCENTSAGPDIHPSDLYTVLANFNKTSYENIHQILKIIGGYLKESLLLNQTTLDAINNAYYENNLQTYILLPMLIYVLQNYKGE